MLESLEDSSVLSSYVGCWSSDTLQNGTSLKFFENPCNIVLLNTATFCCFSYTLFIILLYIKCSSSSTIRYCNKEKTLFIGHTFRAIFSLLLLLTHMIELSIILLGEKPQLSTYTEIIASLLTWILSQILYSKLESIKESKYLSFTFMFWVICGLSRLVQLNFVISKLHLGFEYIRFYTSGFSSVLCVLIALSDLVTAIYQERILDRQLSFGSVKRDIPKNGNTTKSENTHFNSVYRETEYGYRHSYSSWYSKVTFYWLNDLLKAGYTNPLEIEDLGILPKHENALTQFKHFKNVWYTGKNSLQLCYIKLYWKNFVVGGILKLLGDCVGYIGPLGIAVVIQYVNNITKTQSNIDLNNSSVSPSRNVGDQSNYNVTVMEFLSNGYVMSVMVLISGLAQATFSQASTHILNVEGIRLKTALQTLIYWKLLKISTNTLTGNFNVNDQNNMNNNPKILTTTDCNDDTLKSQPDKTYTDKNEQVQNSSVNDNSNNDVNNNNSSYNATNLLSEDVFNIMSCYWIGHYIWAIPLKIIVLMYLLYCKLGISAVIGAITCIVIVLPLQFIVGKKMSTNTKAISEYSDKRLWQVNEVLQGIRLLKLYGWEIDYYNKLKSTRNKELSLLDKDSFYWAIMTFLTHASSVSISLVTFVIYYLLEGVGAGKLTPESVFSGLALFNQLVVPLFIFPITVPIIISAQVSTKRLEEFLKLPEISCSDIYNDDKEMFETDDHYKKIEKKSKKSTTVNRLNVSEIGMKNGGSPFGLMNINELDEDENCSEITTNGNHIKPTFITSLNSDKIVTISNAQFSWIFNDNYHNSSVEFSDNTSTLLSIKHLKIVKGKSTVIIGKIGSGKSSLLNALLGEMKCISGSIKWNKNYKIAYVSQKPWLMSGLLRDNITFGRPFKERRYNKVILACALQPDIDSLPYKDLTEIGEQGVNLSGGQRQRIAIARALYSSAEVLIMDDPLSALDYNVANHVFDEGIKLAVTKYNKTVIMVTHSYRLISHADQVIIMDNCCVSTIGNLKDIQNDKNIIEYNETAINSDKLYNNIIHNEYDEKFYDKNGNDDENDDNDHIRILKRDDEDVKTAKERWKLIKLISSIGKFPKKYNNRNNSGDKSLNEVSDKELDNNPSIWGSSYQQQDPVRFVPFRKRLGTFSGSRYLAHDLLLPTDECEEDDLSQRRHDRYLKKSSGSVRQHKSVLRATSLQANTSRHPLYLPVTRQSSSPNIIPSQLHSITSNCTNTRSVHSTFNGSSPSSAINNIKKKEISENSNGSVVTNASSTTANGILRTANQGTTVGGSTLLRQIFSMSIERSNTNHNVQPKGENSCSNINHVDSKVSKIERQSSVKSVKKQKIENNSKDHIVKDNHDNDSDKDDEDEEEDDDFDDSLLDNKEHSTGLSSTSLYSCSSSNVNSGNSEEREYGKISRVVYLMYINCCGFVLSLLYISTTVLWQLLRIATDFWLSKWSSNQSVTSTDNNNNEHDSSYYLKVYAILSILTVILSLLSNGLGQYCASKARNTLHDGMLMAIIKCPVRFFENTPLGRIINRFSTDIAIIDKKIGTSIQRLFQFILLCLSAVVVNSVVTPWFIALAVPIGIIYYTIQKFYRCSSRELQRLESIARCPVLSHFTETLTGLETIRAFSQQYRFTNIFYSKLDTHTNAFLIFNSANRWLGIALDYLGALIVFLAMLVCLITSTLFHDAITPASVGLAINYTLLMPIYLNWVVKFLSDMEMYMGAVERVTQYANSISEDYRNHCIIPYNWPKFGDIKFNNVSLCYDLNKNQSPVIKNLTLHIPHGQKVGICGRTGSGKSSLVMSLFNMVSIYEGNITIDNEDITKIPLQTLRTKLSIIPQDVIMFSGTIRENLDVRNEYSDNELWSCLESANMKDIVLNELGGLDGKVKEGGVNLSTGQRQLFCLARAILHNAVCLVMDEATSSLDIETENKLLKAALNGFSERTIITIAHRLDNLLQYDRIIVMEAGKIVEDGSPSYLLSRSMGIFSTMMKNSKTGSLQTRKISSTESNISKDL